MKQIFKASTLNSTIIVLAFLFGIFLVIPFPLAQIIFSYLGSKNIELNLTQIFVVAFLNLKSVAINFLIAWWLYYSTKNEKDIRWIWFFLGLVYRLPAVLFYLVFCLHKNREFKMNKKVVIAFFCLSLLSFYPLTILMQMLINYISTPSQLGKISWIISMSRGGILTIHLIAAIGLAIWLYNVCEEKNKWHRRLWGLSTLSLGIYVPIIYFGYLLSRKTNLDAP